MINLDLEWREKSKGFFTERFFTFIVEHKIWNRKTAQSEQIKFIFDMEYNQEGIFGVSFL